MNSYLGKHINNEGWTVMSGFFSRCTRFYEYNNFGEGVKSNLKRRVLNEEEVKKYSKDNLFKDWKI